jgi:hypothetical protein
MALLHTSKLNSSSFRVPALMTTSIVQLLYDIIHSPDTPRGQRVTPPRSVVIGKAQEIFDCGISQTSIGSPLKKPFDFHV